jgi:hypothetical protein
VDPHRFVWIWLRIRIGLITLMRIRMRIRIQNYLFDADTGPYLSFEKRLKPLKILKIDADPAPSGSGL